MTWQAQGDRIELVAAGVTLAAAGFQPASWRGGLGCLTITGLSGTPDFEMSPDSGTTWLDVKELGTGTPIAAVAAAGMWIFLLPMCLIRMSAGGGAMNVLAVGI